MNRFRRPGDPVSSKLRYNLQILEGDEGNSLVDEVKNRFANYQVLDPKFMALAYHLARSQDFSGELEQVLKKILTSPDYEIKATSLKIPPREPKSLQTMIRYLSHLLTR